MRTPQISEDLWECQAAHQRSWRSKSRHNNQPPSQWEVFKLQGGNGWPWKWGVRFATRAADCKMRRLEMQWGRATNLSNQCLFVGTYSKGYLAFDAFIITEFLKRALRTDIWIAPKGAIFRKPLKENGMKRKRENEKLKKTKNNELVQRQRRTDTNCRRLWAKRNDEIDFTHNVIKKMNYSMSKLWSGRRLTL